MNWFTILMTLFVSGSIIATVLLLYFVVLTVPVAIIYHALFKGTES